MTSTPGGEGDGGIGVPFDAIGGRDADAPPGSSGQAVRPCAGDAPGACADSRADRALPLGFPRTARLLSAAEFATMFRMRPLKRSEHFVVYARPREGTGGLPGRMGLVLGKKAAPRAATRNMVRRALRETFRQRKAEYAGWDLLIRMHLRFDKQRFPGAASPALRRACRAEVQALLDEAGRHVARRRPALAP